jgi:hypothetical protein
MQARGKRPFFISYFSFSFSFLFFGYGQEQEQEQELGRVMEVHWADGMVGFFFFFFFIFTS